MAYYSVLEVSLATLQFIVEERNQLQRTETCRTRLAVVENFLAGQDVRKSIRAG